MHEEKYRKGLHLCLLQHFRLNTVPDPDPIRIHGLDDQKLKKNLQLKKFLLVLDQKLQFIYP